MQTTKGEEEGRKFGGQDARRRFCGQDGNCRVLRVGVTHVTGMVGPGGLKRRDKVGVLTTVISQ